MAEWSPYKSPAGNLAGAIVDGVPLISEILELLPPTQGQDPKKGPAQQRADLPDVSLSGEVAQPVGDPPQLPAPQGQQPVSETGGQLPVSWTKGRIFRELAKRVGKASLPVRILSAVNQSWNQLSPGQQEGIGGFLEEFLPHIISSTGVPQGIASLLPEGALSRGVRPGGDLSQIPLSLPAPVYRSALSDAVDALSMERGSATQILNTLGNTKGVKEVELEQTGLRAFLEDIGSGSVTKQKVQGFLANKGTGIKETILTDKGDIGLDWSANISNDPDQLRIQSRGAPYEITGNSREGFKIAASHRERGTFRRFPTVEEAQVQAQVHHNDWLRRYGGDTGGGARFKEHLQGTTKGTPVEGEYRELVLQFPEINKYDQARFDELQTAEESALLSSNPRGMEGLVAEFDELNLARKKYDDTNYTGGHWRDLPNVFGSALLDTYIDTDGNRILHIAEAQSDLHNTARELRSDEIDNVARELFVKKLRPEDRWLRSLVDNPQAKTLSAHPDDWVRDLWNTAVKDAKERVPGHFGYRTGQDVHRDVTETELKRWVPGRFLHSKNTWHKKVLGRVLRMAAEGDYDGVTWDSGEVIAERWQRGDKRTLYDKMIPHEIEAATGSKVEDISFPSFEFQKEVYQHSKKGVKLTPEMRRRLLGRSIPDFARGGLVDMEDEDYYREHMDDPDFGSGGGNQGPGSQDDDEQEREPRYDPLTHARTDFHRFVAPEPVQGLGARFGEGIASLGRGAWDKVREYASIPTLLGTAASFATGSPLIGLGIRGIGKGMAQRLEDRRYYPGGRETYEDYWRDVDSPRKKIIDFRAPSWPEDDQQNDLAWWRTTINPLTGRYYESDPQLSQGIPRGEYTPGEEPDPKRTAFNQWQNIADKASSEAQRLKDIWYGPPSYTDDQLSSIFLNQGGYASRDRSVPSEQLGSYSSFNRDGVSGSQFNIRTPSGGYPIGPDGAPLVRLEGGYGRQGVEVTPEALGIPQETIRQWQLGNLEQESSTWNLGIAAYLPDGVLPDFMDDVLRPKSVNVRYGRSRSETTTPSGESWGSDDRMRGIGGQGQVLRGMFGNNAPTVEVDYGEPNLRGRVISGKVNVPVAGGDAYVSASQSRNEGRRNEGSIKAGWGITF
jgi:hypothetical protein